jgi:hypothetical protein
VPVPKRTHNLSALVQTLQFSAPTLKIDPVIERSLSVITTCATENVYIASIDCEEFRKHIEVIDPYLEKVVAHVRSFHE